MQLPSEKQISIWAEQYLKGTISEADKIALNNWYKQLSEQEIASTHDKLGISEALQQELYENIQNTIKAPQKKRIHYKRQITTIAATLLLIIASSVILWHQYHQDDLSSNQNNKQLLVHDATPASVKAVLTLADGSKIILDPSKNGTLAIQGNTTISHSNGEISYRGKTPTANTYNTLTTNRGQQSPQLLLADGTKVWLNAASSIRFPVAFMGKTRTVEITGEAYFEVAKDAKHPFIVKAGGTQVKVLGTHFNVKDYQGEPFIETTLLEGAIQLTSNNQAKFLVPGQQGKTSHKGGKIQVSKVNTADIMGWMNGQLSLNNTDIKALMRELSRWYNIDIKYVGNAPKLSFSGTISRQLNLSNILAALKANGIKTTLNNKILTVYEN